MNTFKQVIDLFIEGATSAKEGIQEKPYAKLMICGKSLLWVTKDVTYITAIRISDKLIIKNTAWHNRPPISEFRYINRKCRADKVHLEKSEFAPIPEYNQPGFGQERYIHRMEEVVTTRIGEDLLSMLTSNLSEPQRAFKKEYNMCKTRKSTLNAIRGTKAIHMYLGTHGTGKIDKPTLNDMIFNIERTRRALLKIDSYLQVCMALPEISSPGIIEQDEHPGGKDSCSSPLSEYSKNRI